MANVWPTLTVTRARNAAKVGAGATIHYHSDSHACTVTRISPSGNAIWLQRDKATLLNGSASGEPDALTFTPGGFVGHTAGTQRWDIKPDPEGAIYKATLRKDGRYRLVGFDVGGLVTLGVRDHHHDFNF